MKDIFQRLSTCWMSKLRSLPLTLTETLPRLGAALDQHLGGALLHVVQRGDHHLLGLHAVGVHVVVADVEDDLGQHPEAGEVVLAAADGRLGTRARARRRDRRWPRSAAGSWGRGRCRPGPRHRAGRRRWRDDGRGAAWRSSGQPCACGGRLPREGPEKGLGIQEVGSINRDELGWLRSVITGRRGHKASGNGNSALNNATRRVAFPSVPLRGQEAQCVLAWKASEPARPSPR